MSQANSKRTLMILVGVLVLVAIIFGIVMWTAGTPKSEQPPPDMAPSTN